ncbi:hypothetical protein GMSM_27290 [Geomonas sp. Red276]
MSWLPFAAMSTACSVFILMLVNTYLYRCYRESFLKKWAIAWGIYVVRYLALASSTLGGQGLPATVIYYLSIILSSVVLLAGTRQFIGKPPARWLVVCGATLSVWSLIAPLWGLPPLWLVIPVFAFLGCTYIHVGFQVIKASRSGDLASPIVGWLFVIWGVHQFDYPLLRPIDWIAPWGFLFGGIMALGIAIGMLLAYFERINHERRESEQRFRAIFDNSPIAIGLGELVGGRLVEVNPAWLTLFGFEREEVIGRTTEELGIYLRDEDRDRIIVTIQTQGRIVNSSLQMRHRSGEARDIMFSAETVNLDGWPYLQMMMTDVSELRKMDLALRTSEERFRSIMALSPDIISTIDEHGVLTYNSPAARAIHGYGDEEMLGRNTFDLIHPEDQPKVAAAFEALIADPATPQSIRYRYRNKDGSYIWMEATAVNRLATPLVHGIVTISRDITDRMVEESRRLDLERSLLHAQKLESLGILAGGIAHDFNNLLAAILGNLDLAQMKLPAGSPVRANLDQSITACRRGADLTRQLLAYAGRGVFQLKPLDLDTIVAGNTDLFRTVIPKGINLTMLSCGRLPAVMADPGQIQQVVMNLITNAAEAIGNRPGIISVSTGVMRCDRETVQKSVLAEKPSPGEFVYLEVADNGAGMGAETRARLFEPFFTTKFTGRGLGMAATLGIVKSHRGLILLESEAGRGTTFRICFPVAEGVSLPAAAPGNPSRPSEEPGERKGTILVVDDEDQVRDLGAGFAEHLGFAALAARNGEEAVKIYRERASEIDLVILDLTMPVMDGVATFRELKKVDPCVRTILSSGYSEQAIADQFPGEKPDAFIQKPFQLADLEQKIQEALR